jgi:hypothetical protein
MEKSVEEERRQAEEAAEQARIEAAEQARLEAEAQLQAEAAATEGDTTATLVVEAPNGDTAVIETDVVEVTEGEETADGSEPVNPDAVSNSDEVTEQPADANSDANRPPE